MSGAANKGIPLRNIFLMLIEKGDVAQQRQKSKCEHWYFGNERQMSPRNQLHFPEIVYSH